MKTTLNDLLHMLIEQRDSWGSEAEWCFANRDTVDLPEIFRENTMYSAVYAQMIEHLLGKMNGEVSHSVEDIQQALSFLMDNMDHWKLSTKEQFGDMEPHLVDHAYNMASRRVKLFQESPTLIRWLT